MLFANSSLFWFKVTNEHREFRNYLFREISFKPLFFPSADIQLLLERRIDFTAVSAVEFLCILCHIAIQFVHVDICEDRTDDRAL